MAIRGILFDKDGTLVDFHKTWHAIGDRLALEAAGGDRGKANDLMELAGYDFEAGRFRGDSVFAAGTNADIVALWYANAPQDEHEARVRHFDAVTAAEGARSAVPLDGVLDALRDLHKRGYKLGVATNDSEGGAKQTIQAIGVAHLFVAAYGYDSVARPKPAPDAIEAFCALTGFAPDEIAMVGDNRHDLEMARAGRAGLAVGVLSGTGTQERLAPLADVVLSSVRDLPAYLAG
ncbi:HAD family hydrolase [Aquibium sp. ELW1220]|uniref:HAD family hydrolase n=1 Tax=Aquibium sp. ELW1220 TaxID=2976766 RepID=UPI0025B08AA4|nr:HAD family hydrolase [Aquibium sp. ELW1220]MDN2581651.1 HAD family hydrolase [Aquibium sp. ELW1220]